MVGDDLFITAFSLLYFIDVNPTVPSSGGKLW